MAICALPQWTVRLLGSSVNITTPCDLVKELVDNAIDAEATSIEIFISADTVEKISVHDNGHGIAVEDFDSLGRRAHTSKLRSFDELQTKGGKTLGFRGEALASANSLASICVTTKVSGDPVATRLQLRPGAGGVQDQRPVSAPVGTTVQAAQLFKNIPARRQQLLKEKHKTMLKIKELLRAYVLARPHLKMSFKVTSDNGQSWSYAPSQSPTVREAALQIFGRNLAANCVQMTLTGWHHGDSQIQSGGLQRTTFTLDTFIPKRDCDADAIRNKGVFISVDRRPVSSANGFPKKMAGILKSHLARSGLTKAQKSPFMQLNIRCPPRSYDANVSPMKDEVLFVDEKELLECFEDLCRKLYGGEESLAGDNSRVVNVLSDKAGRMDLSTLLDGNDDDDLTDASPLDDAEILDMLDKIVASDAVPHTHEKQQPASSSSHPESVRIDERLAVGPVQATMRTITRVDMARTESNTTDEHSAVELLDVQIPPPAAKPKATPEQPGPQPRLSEDIHRYFQPTRRQDFDIACDDTASANEPSEANDISQPGGSEPTNRPPLQPLNDSEVNRLQGELESVSEFSDIEPDILRPYQEPQRDLDAPFARRGQGVIGRDEFLERIGRLSPPSPSHPFTSNTAAENPPSSPSPNEHALLPTPPSSDPIRGERPPNPPLRPHGRRNAIVPRQRQTQRSNMLGTGVTAADRLAQTTITSMAERFRKRGEIDFDFGRESSIGEEIPRLPDIPQDHESGRQQGHFQAASQLGIHASEPTRTRLSHMGNQYSHVSQALLMRTPHPVLDSEPTSAMDRIKGVENPYEVFRQGAPRAHSVTSRRSSTDSLDGDARRYLIRRQRSRAIHGHQRRLSSRRLPLETICADRGTHDISGTIHLACSDVQSRMDQLAMLDPYIRYGSLSAALPFRDMTEVELVEDRLRLQVKSWMAKEKIKVKDIEYRLQSEAKGKGRG
ncbi:Uncharacterized protein TPAR_08537 [Tolypocladium paradoxum]|uniref:DNA mismatch repair protein S5 domain-containing protein n=1 Tax=Tolypocladium paradoxum TaxID=94208 RepID=A0A2S4KM33_9HYPO|nr:Uncharacterized protein TPAR_08537 [Tolypocladium paradoxum]